MRLPVARLNRSVRNRVSAMDHHSVAYIDTDVRCTGGIISALEENQISRFSGASWDDVAYTHQPVGCQSADTPTISAVIDNPRNETGTVERGGRTTAAP